ncbi:MAG TPA: EAL domain-containing protein [Nocardioides sp.]|nr:EAL domain-containing protein [Nocardioides sp.]
MPADGVPAVAHEGDAAPGRGLYRTALVVACGVLGLYLAWLLLDVGDPAVRASVTHLVSTSAALLAATACWRAHRLRAGRHLAWAWLALGCVTWSGGAITSAALSVTVRAEVSLPSAADVALLGFAVPAAVAMFRFPRCGGRTLSRWRLALDSVVLAGCLLAAAAIWVLSPVLLTVAPQPGARAVALAYPLVGACLAAFVLARSTVFPIQRRRVWLLLSAAFLVLTVTDSLHVARLFRGEYAPGGPLDVGWALAFTLIALSALAPVVDPASPAPAVGEVPTTLYEQLVPYLAMGLVLVAVAVNPTAIEAGSPHRWFLVPLLAVVAVRQVVVVADHTTLARTLAQAVERRTAELVREQQWWREVVQNLSDVVVVVDEDLKVRYCSPSADHVLGSWPQRVRDASEMAVHVHPDDRDAVVAVIAPVLAGRRRRGFVECRVRRADGGWGWFEVTTVGQLAEEQLAGTVLTLHDVSERRRLTDRLAHEAYHDPLTGLPNRALLMTRIEEVLATSGEERPALLLVDLDDFKVINDRHGHASGDLVLEVIGRRLRAAVRAGDTVARLGGDEFALLMRGTPEQVRSTAERLIEEIGKPVLAGGRRFLVRASVGVVLAAAEREESPHSLLSHADIALYQAKGSDKGGVVFIDGHERDAAAKQVHLREEIASPDLTQFRVVYQPIVDLQTGRMRGVEALLRWRHPDLGDVPPDTFIPMAEAGGSIQELGWFVLREACAQLASWRREAPDHRMAVGINVSSRQLDEAGFAAGVLALVDEHGLDPPQLVLELTEQSLALDFETAVEVVAELRAGGVSVAVDDYGTGYSSLRYLHRFDADVVKIDRSFIAYLEDSLHTQKIVRSVMDMATSLDLQSIGEGIESYGQVALLRSLGCELGQGYLFSRPVEAVRIGALLRADACFPVEPDDAEGDTPGATVTPLPGRDGVRAASSH